MTTPSRASEPSANSSRTDAIPVTSASPTVSLWLERRIASKTLASDPDQERLARRFDRLITELKPGMKASKSAALGWFMARKAKAASPVRGVYVHGGVGRGKTMLMDIFFKRCPDPRKRRAHFHAFMADVQDRINAHREKVRTGATRETDPIPPVARAIASESRVICFDEFTVTDIADAMILSRLFSALFKNGVVLVATSNVAPDDLYRDGLNRSLFLPFLDVLRAHVDVIDFRGERDYRLEKLAKASRYFTPLDAPSARAVEALWLTLMDGAQPKAEYLKVMGREVKVPQAALGKARFSFQEICGTALGARDYAAVADAYHTVFVTDIPVLTPTMRNEAKRFILLVDTLYDAKRHLIVSADAEPDALCALASGTERFEFARTASRLIEMRSDAWLTTAETATTRRPQAQSPDS